MWRWCSRRASMCAWTGTSGSSTTTDTPSPTLRLINTTSRTPPTRPHPPPPTPPIDGAPDEPFILHPGEFALGSTFELVTLPDDIAARLEGKGSRGPLGLPQHSSAGV